MKKIFLLGILSSLLMGANMSGWNSGEEEATKKVEKEERARMCRLYTTKIKKYKETMRDDGLALVTLNNYIRLQTQYCDSSENNHSKS